MKVFFTGGLGRVGRSAVERLIEAGHSVTVAGLEAEAHRGRAVYRRCDICDFASLRRLMDGHDCVVHLAAIAHPIGLPGRELFRVNDLGSFNVYEAAAECGIRRVVAASSINAIGFYFGDRGFPIDYLPIDEHHPGQPTDAYSFSKATLERIGAYFWERDAISGVMLRLPAVYRHERVVRPPRDETRELLAEILALDEQSRRGRVLSLHEAYDRYRRLNRAETLARNLEETVREEFDAAMGRGAMMLMVNVANFFAYVDELDCAQAIEKSLTAEYDGCVPLFINSRGNSAGTPITQLAQLYHPVVATINPTREGDDCLVSIERARALIGFEPEWELAV